MGRHGMGTLLLSLLSRPVLLLVDLDPEWCALRREMPCFRRLNPCATEVKRPISSEGIFVNGFEDSFVGQEMILRGDWHRVGANVTRETL